MKKAMGRMRSYEDILGMVRQALQPFVKDGREVGEETELVADLGLDSVQVMKLLLEIEDRFDVSIPLNILPDVRTVRDFVVQLQQLENETQ